MHNELDVRCVYRCDVSRPKRLDNEDDGSLLDSLLVNNANDEDDGDRRPAASKIWWWWCDGFEDNENALVKASMNGDVDKTTTANDDRIFLDVIFLALTVPASIRYFDDVIKQRLWNWKWMCVNLRLCDCGRAGGRKTSQHGGKPTYTGVSYFVAHQFLHVLPFTFFVSITCFTSTNHDEATQQHVHYSFLLRRRLSPSIARSLFTLTHKTQPPTT